MRDFTVSVDNETSTRASVAGALLGQLAAQETETERLKRQERELRNKITAFDESSRLSREDLHDRHG